MNFAKSLVAIAAVLYEPALADINPPNSRNNNSTQRKDNVNDPTNNGFSDPQDCSKIVNANNVWCKPNIPYYEKSNPVDLKVNANGKFKILQLTDLHLGEDEGRDTQTVNTISTIIGREIPDFVVITGDLVSGQVNSMRKGSFYGDAAAPLLSLFESFHLPWSLVPGYYDHINGMDDEAIGRVTGGYK
jgi:hypothetical protein